MFPSLHIYKDDPQCISVGLVLRPIHQLDKAFGSLFANKSAPSIKIHGENPCLVLKHSACSDTLSRTYDTDTDRLVII